MAVSDWAGRGYGWLAERLYNELAWIYDPVSWFVSAGHWDEWRKLVLEHISGRRVLEVGFGTGELLLELARREFSVYGLEPSHAMQRQTAVKLSRQNVYVPRVRGICQLMPFPDHAFDTILVTFPAGYVFDSATWCEASRVLRKPGDSSGSGGRFVIAGICVSSKHTLSAPLAWLSSGTVLQEVLGRCRQVAVSAGFDFRVVGHQVAAFEVPVIVAERVE